jgi:hypothetical protein
VLGFQFGNETVIDGDAAGYGYSTSRIDLPVVEHELGHSLGFDHDVLGESLALETGPLPASSSSASKSPPVSGASPASGAAIAQTGALSPRRPAPTSRGLALGAAGAMLGTRFVATPESRAHPAQ